MLICKRMFVLRHVSTCGIDHNEHSCPALDDRTSLHQEFVKKFITSGVEARFAPAYSSIHNVFEFICNHRFVLIITSLAVAPAFCSCRLCLARILCSCSKRPLRTQAQEGLILELNPSVLSVTSVPSVASRPVRPVPSAPSRSARFVPFPSCPAWPIHPVRPVRPAPSVSSCPFRPVPSRPFRPVRPVPSVF